MHRFKFTIFNRKTFVALSTLDIICVLASAAVVGATVVLYLLPVFAQK